MYQIKRVPIGVIFHVEIIIGLNIFYVRVYFSDAEKYSNKISFVTSSFSTEFQNDSISYMKDHRQIITIQLINNFMRVCELNAMTSKTVAKTNILP
jgi:hypothetical protein